MYRLRVFLSYAHADRTIVNRMDAVLADMGLSPVWDRELSAGQPFDDGIRRHIATAHVFMPVLTAASSRAVGTPGDRICPRHWCARHPHRTRRDLAGNDRRVAGYCGGRGSLRLSRSPGTGEARIVGAPGAHRSELERIGITTQIADFSEERTKLLVMTARHVAPPATVRQRALFSSFALPDRPASHAVWDSLDLIEPRSHYSGACFATNAPFLRCTPGKQDVH